MSVERARALAVAVRCLQTKLHRQFLEEGGRGGPFNGCGAAMGAPPSPVPLRCPCGQEKEEEEGRKILTTSSAMEWDEQKRLENREDGAGPQFFFLGRWDNDDVLISGRSLPCAARQIWL